MKWKKWRLRKLWRFANRGSASSSDPNQRSTGLRFPLSPRLMKAPPTQKKPEQPKRLASAPKVNWRESQPLSHKGNAHPARSPPTRFACSSLCPPIRMGNAAFGCPARLFFRDPLARHSLASICWGVLKEKRKSKKRKRDTPIWTKTGRKEKSNGWLSSEKGQK